jgi:hypothetical protein
MLPATSLLQLALGLSTFGRFTLASPDQVLRAEALEPRQDDADTTADEPPAITFEPEGDETDSASNEDEDEQSEIEPTKTTASGARKTADLNTAKPASGTRKSSEPTHTQFAADLPAGGVEMLTPTAIAASTALYKIGDHVTWGWNYTSLLGKPDHIDILISCATASETWTLASNVSFETSVDFVWDTRKEENDPEQPLLTELYTLIVKDSEAEISDSPEPGYLGVYSGFTFGLYARQSYTALPDWECTGCNAAAPGFNGQAVGLALIMSLISVLSFTWFVTGLGLQ